MVRQHRVVDHIVDQLCAAGGEYMFGVDGANIEDLYDAAYFHDDVTAGLAKHEFSAATIGTGALDAEALFSTVSVYAGGSPRPNRS
jgi:acetolactate synthase-1/2/3 large subunit